MESSELSAAFDGGAAALSLTVRLTNFLGASALSVEFGVALTMRTLPVIEIVGGGLRTLVRRSSLSVEASGLATACDGSPVAERHVSYAWRLYAASGEHLDALTSVANNPRFYILGAFQLEARSSYRLVVMAIDEKLGLNNTDETTIEVTPKTRPHRRPLQTLSRGVSFLSLAHTRCFSPSALCLSLSVSVSPSVSVSVSVCLSLACVTVLTSRMRR